MLETATPGRDTKGRTTQYEKNGGYQKAMDGFNSLDVRNIRDLPNGKGKVGELPDGRTINVRNGSSEGSPTLEILEGKNKIKIRYK